MPDENGYADRFAQLLQHMLYLGITSPDVLHALRINSKDDRWDDEAGHKLLQQCSQDLPADNDTQTELFYVLGIGQPHEYANGEFNGDSTRADWLITGEYPKRVYGAGRYNNSYTRFLMDEYCRCQNDTRKGNRYSPKGALLVGQSADQPTDQPNTDTTCEICDRRDRIERAALALIDSQKLI